MWHHFLGGRVTRAALWLHCCLTAGVLLLLLRLYCLQGPGGVANLHVQTQLDEATGGLHTKFKEAGRLPLEGPDIVNMWRVALHNISCRHE
jgi:hypothetical protein